MGFGDFLDSFCEGPSQEEQEQQLLSTIEYKKVVDVLAKEDESYANVSLNLTHQANVMGLVDFTIEAVDELMYMNRLSTNKLCLKTFDLPEVKDKVLSKLITKSTEYNDYMAVMINTNANVMEHDRLNIKQNVSWKDEDVIKSIHSGQDKFYSTNSTESMFDLTPYEKLKLTRLNKLVNDGIDDIDLDELVSSMNKVLDINTKEVEDVIDVEEEVIEEEVLKESTTSIIDVVDSSIEEMNQNNNSNIMFI